MTLCLVTYNVCVVVMDHDRRRRGWPGFESRVQPWPGQEVLVVHLGLDSVQGSGDGADHGVTGGPVLFGLKQREIKLVMG